MFFPSWPERNRESDNVSLPNVFFYTMMLDKTMCSKVKHGSWAGPNVLHDQDFTKNKTMCSTVFFFFFFENKWQNFIQRKNKIIQEQSSIMESQRKLYQLQSFPFTYQKTAAYARLHQGKPKKKNEIIRLVLKNIAIFGSFLLCIIWSATSAWHYDRS